MVELQDNLWIINDKYQLWRFNGQVWDEAGIPEISNLVKERNERLYAIEKQGPILVYEGRAWQRLPDCAQCGAYTSPRLSTYAANGIWITFDSGIWRYAKDAGWCRMLIFPQHDLLTNPYLSPVTSILIDMHGDLWITNYLKEVLHCNQENCELWDFGSDPGWESSTTTIAEDLQGRIWIGGWGLLSVYDPAAER